MWDVLRSGVFAPESTSQSAGVRFPGFGESIVAGIEIFALRELLREEVLLVGQFAVETEELRFFL